MSGTLRLTLHPQHLGAAGSVGPLAWPLRAPSRAQRLRDLSHWARRALAELQDGRHLAAMDCEVLRTCDSLVISSDGYQDVHVPFFLAEVGYAQQESMAVVAFGRHPQRHAGESSESKVWLIVVPGGQVELQSFLFILSKGGVIRGDIEKECAMPNKPFAHGASSDIYKVQRVLQTKSGHLELGGELAAKVMPAESASDVSRVDREVDMLLKAQGHPNIIRFRGIFFYGPEAAEDLDGEGRTNQLAGKAILLTDYYTRGSIWKCVRRKGAFAEGEALGLSNGVLSALAHIHRHDIVHRDVKAENVLQGKDGRAVLTDFGIACSVHDAKAMQVRCGTPGYAAPEMVTEDSPYGKKVDVFGVGVMLYFTTFGCTPFELGDKGKTQILRLTRECSVTFPGNRAVTAQLKRVILVFLAKDPEDRPSCKSAMDVIELVQHAKPHLAALPGGSQAAAAASSRRNAAADSQRPSTSSSVPPGPRPQRQGEPAGAAMQPRPPSASPGTKRRTPGIGRFFSRASSPAEAAKPRFFGSEASSGDEVDRPTPASCSSPGSPYSAGSNSGSLSPSWRIRAPSKASQGPRNHSLIPSVDKLCPSFLRRRRAEAIAMGTPGEAMIMEGVVP